MSETVITGTAGQVVGKNTSVGTVFELTIGSQKVNTWKEPMAQEAKALEGSEVEATIDTTENKNGYPKNTLLAIKLAGSTVVESSQAREIPVVEQQQQYQRPMSPETEARVTKLSCFNAACNLYAGLGEEDAAIEFAKHLYGIAMAQQEQAEPVAVGAEPTESDDGIPW